MAIAAAEVQQVERHEVAAGRVVVLVAVMAAALAGLYYVARGMAGN